MKRREFITLVGGAGIAWPLAARAQQDDGIRVVGLLTTENDSEHRPTIHAFQEELAKLGWVENHNLRIYFRFFRGDPDYINTYAARRDLGVALGDLPISANNPTSFATQNALIQQCGRMFE